MENEKKMNIKKSDDEDPEKRIGVTSQKHFACVKCECEYRTLVMIMR